MIAPSSARLGGSSLVGGAVLLAIYSILFAALLPIASSSEQFAQVVSNPNWRWLAVMAFVAVLLMMIGFDAVHQRLRVASGRMLEGAGYLLIQTAFLLQASRITWEICFYPIIATHAESVFLIKDSIIIGDQSVVIFLAFSALTIFAGVTLFSLALYRSDLFPKWAAILIFIGAITYAIGPTISIYVEIVGVCVLSLGCIKLGTCLWASPMGA